MAKRKSPFRSIPGTFLGGALALAFGVWALPLGAEVFTAPESIRHCLCAEQDIAALSQDVRTQFAAYEDAWKRLDTLNDLVRTKRPQINVNNPEEVDAFRRLLAERDGAEKLFTDKTSPDYAALVSRYNGKVSEFNAGCGDKSYDAAVLARVKAGLTCP